MSTDIKKYLWQNFSCFSLSIPIKKEYITTKCGLLKKYKLTAHLKPLYFSTQTS